MIGKFEKIQLEGGAKIMDKGRIERYPDKLIDELAKGKRMEKILRKV